MRYEHVAIDALAYELPSMALRTSAIEGALKPLYSRLGIKPGWLEAVTGIQERRVWAPGTNPSDVATRAAEKALDQARVAREDLDVLVSCSVCRDYLEPSVACLVHGNLGLRSSCVNFDVGNACLGFLSGMTVVANMIELGQANSGMVVAGEGSRPVIEATLDRLLRPDATASTFRDNLATLTLGSAAVAMVLRRADVSRTPHRFRGGLTRAASQFNRLCVGTDTYMTTDPPRLLTEGVALAGRTWAEMEQWPEWRRERMAEFALHQVGKANHDSLVRALNLPPERALKIYPQLGNVGAAGVPLTLARSLEQGRVTQGNSVALMGIGSGLNVSMMSVDW